MAFFRKKDYIRYPLEVLYFLKVGDLFFAVKSPPSLRKKDFFSNGKRVFFLERDLSPFIAINAFHFLQGNGANNANYLVGFFKEVLALFLAFPRSHSNGRKIFFLAGIYSPLPVGCGGDFNERRGKKCGELKEQ